MGQHARRGLWLLSYISQGSLIGLPGRNAAGHLRSESSMVAHLVAMLFLSKDVGDNYLKHSRECLDLVGKPLKCLRSYHRGPWVWPSALVTLVVILLAPNVVGLPLRPVDPYNKVRVASMRGAPRWQSEVDGRRCSDCDFDAGLSNLVGLFLQDKTSRVVGSRGSPSDDQVMVDLKGDVERPA
ncbi:hypothetical protein B296_00056724 [Ensete ventricosum]|uniref:Uncharacterized protein n=1 Tax=Ensete ventricosum TaxID=4639 RepID=A0A426XU26_ENSVE|nr:hypothetical protein B296_00056724 [Ensete ventricosum]